MFGAGGSTSSYEEAENTDVVFLWGSNAREAHPIWFHHLLKGIRKGTRLYVMDPRRTTSVSSTSSYELVPPPAPKTVARPTTLGACHVRLQLSTLLDPKPTRASFPAR